MKNVLGVVLKILGSDAATVVMGLALAYGYIKFAIAAMDYMVEDGQ